MCIRDRVEVEEEVTIQSDSEDLFKLPGVEYDYNQESINKPYYREEESNWGLELEQPAPSNNPYTPYQSKAKFLSTAKNNNQLSNAKEFNPFAFDDLDVPPALNSRDASRDYQSSMGFKFTEKAKQQQDNQQKKPVSREWQLGEKSSLLYDNKRIQQVNDNPSNLSVHNASSIINQNKSQGTIFSRKKNENKGPFNFFDGSRMQDNTMNFDMTMKSQEQEEEKMDQSKYRSLSLIHI
eukprot:TRINITY_DN1331_c0_g1_i2.p3 TRINITY_DN1331_c0_g1~~TRINITY_DN1331_c0_g1_i2.p3  ORF type:complete len:237 (-),score=44.01 TRINITY_DN1331_c0_g1_i2:165-875(-)